MKPSLCYSITLAVTCFIQSAVVYAAVDPAAASVMLRTSCTENNILMNNCFTSMQDVALWMQSTRKPNASSPLKIDIGPGTYSGRVEITCNPADNFTGYTSFSGSGADQSKFTSATGQGVMKFAACTKMNFSHLRAGDTAYGGIIWAGGGDSTWNDVILESPNNVWYEEGCAETRGSHYWHSSVLRSNSVFGDLKVYNASCDESWFFGSEITGTVHVDSPTNTSGQVISAKSKGIVHVYGSVIRALIDNENDPTKISVVLAGGARASAGGEVHIHGTGIDVICPAGAGAIVHQALSGGLIHANQAAYNLQTTGQITRILNSGGHIHASYAWEPHPEAPAILSVDGADTAVVTNTVDGLPHTVIYTSICPSNWYDTSINACR